MNANHNQHKQARKIWAEIAFKSFPFRHEKSLKGNKARDMLKSMILHGKAWKRWAKDHKIEICK